MSPSLASSYDVVVIGGGLAGHAAALSAAEAGAGVLLVEKEDKFGGSTVLSGGFMAFADTPMQRAAGLSDDRAILVDDLRKTGGGHQIDRLIEAYGDAQADLFAWLTKLGVDFSGIELSAGQSVPRSHRTDPARMIEILHDAALRRGVTFATGTKAERLLREGDTVRGVRVVADGAERDIAARAVILATGGFSRSEELLRTFAPGQSKAVRMGGAGSTGDGLRMAWQLGANLRDMGQVKGTFGAHPAFTPECHEIMLLFYSGAIIVNREGRRFVDESLPYKELGDACLRQTDALCWQVFDDALFSAAPHGMPLFDPRPALERGLLISAPTIEALAETCGIDAPALAATVAAYNRAVETRHDPEFGRDGLCNHVGTLIPIIRPPFYAYPSTTAVLATYCGVAVDENARVRDVFDAPIEGLFAAGEIVGGFHGATYMTGTSLGKAALFGRAAGRNAAAQARA